VTQAWTVSKRLWTPMGWNQSWTIRT